MRATRGRPSILERLTASRPIKALACQTALVALLATTAVVGLPTGAADAAPTTPAETTTSTVDAAGDTPYTPTPGTVFNNPKGSHAKQYAIMIKIKQSINAAPAGSTIRMAQYLFDLRVMSNALIRAHKRGVNVQVLIDDGETSKAIKELKAALGRDKTKPSYVFACRRGCMSSVRSVMHAKFYLFSQVGTASNISMLSSANPYTGNTYKSFNDMETIVGDAKLYGALNQYFDDMLRDKTNYNYYWTTTSGKYTLYFYPRTPAPGTSGVPQLSALRKVKCTGVKAGYGLNGRTTIRVAMWGWTKWRTDIATELWKRHNEGCNVYIILNKKRVGEKVFRALLKRSSRHGTMRVYDMWYDKNHNGAAELYMHQKLMTINGNFEGRQQKVLWTGSQNFTDEGNRVNNELLVKIADNKTTDAFNKNLNFIRDRYTKSRIRSMPPSSYFHSSATNGVTVQGADGKLRTFDDYELPANGDVDFDR